jgi:hypothetical protein
MPRFAPVISTVGASGFMSAHAPPDSSVRASTVSNRFVIARLLFLENRKLIARQSVFCLPLASG